MPFSDICQKDGRNEITVLTVQAARMNAVDMRLLISPSPQSPVRAVHNSLHASSAPFVTYTPRINTSSSYLIRNVTTRG